VTGSRTDISATVLMPALWAAISDPVLVPEHAGNRVLADEASLPSGAYAAAAASPTAAVDGRLVAVHSAGMSH
jgi:hypothetical protein